MLRFTGRRKEQLDEINGLWMGVVAFVWPFLHRKCQKSAKGGNQALFDSRQEKSNNLKSQRLKKGKETPATEHETLAVGQRP
jgi:hypothetical protein